jgi:hypothetical protein
MRTQISWTLLSSLLLLACSGGGGGNLVVKPMPDEGSFQGVFFSQQYGEMNLIQNGSAVVGEYKSEQRFGRLQGEAEGNLLRFEWTEKKAMISNRANESRGHGYFHYEIDKSNGQHVLVGEWGLGDDHSGGGPWRAYRMKGKEPKLSGDDSSSGGEEEESSSGSSDDESTDDDLF